MPDGNTFGNIRVAKDCWEPTDGDFSDVSSKHLAGPHGVSEIVRAGRADDGAEPISG
jgi:hypothetical protein